VKLHARLNVFVQKEWIKRKPLGHNVVFSIDEQYPNLCLFFRTGLYELFRGWIPNMESGRDAKYRCLEASEKIMLSGGGYDMSRMA
jgi:hypothetical protein